MLYTTPTYCYTRYTTPTYCCEQHTPMTRARVPFFPIPAWCCTQHPPTCMFPCFSSTRLLRCTSPACCCAALSPTSMYLSTYLLAAVPFFHVLTYCCTQHSSTGMWSLLTFNSPTATHPPTYCCKHLPPAAVHNTHLLHMFNL